MKLNISLVLLILLSLQRIAGQSHFSVEKTKFSTNTYDEFCPVFYGDRIVYCSNIEDGLFITYENKNKKGLFNIFSISKNEARPGKKPVIFSRNIVTPYNDGPVSFSSDGRLLVYSRNIDDEVKVRNVSDMGNTLGLFFAELINDEWTNIKGFKYNSHKYSITTPCFSPDGRYLYFSSDMPGGFGGTDIFRSEFSEGNWLEPENLGKIINTKGNEGYPFITLSGDLFFASDGHSGLGNKDIFVTRWSDERWITPTDLQAPINSEFDDFGFITDSVFSCGYFSSSRGKTDDIYEFSMLVPQLFNCDTLKNNQYCYKFWDEKYPGVDSLPVIYEWEFSDGFKIRGLQVEHCFPGAGKYSAKLNIIDLTTDSMFLTQSSMEFELTDFVQPFIISRDASLNNEEMKFNGLSSNLPDLKIEEYIWDFGDGDFTTGAEVSHKYLKPGVYGVKLGVSGYNEAKKTRETKCIIKPVAIVSDNQTLAMYLNGIKSTVSVKHESGENDTNNVYSNIVNKGFTTARVNTFLVAELPSEMVTRINRDFAELTDANLDFDKSMVAETSFPLLDRIAKIMIENPVLVMEIATHTDNIDSIDNNLQLSQNIAQSIVDYLISKGIEKQRMVAKGYGESRPISSNDTEDGRIKNRRVEFIIVNDKR